MRALSNLIQIDPFFIGRCSVSRFYAGMRGSERVGTAATSLNMPADQVRGRTVARRSQRARRDEQRAKTTSVAVVLSLFLVRLAAGLQTGGRVLDPLLHAAAEVREAHRASKIVLTMPGGAFCRQLSFDNKTAELTEGAVEQCPQTDLREPARSGKGFAWGGR